MANRQEQITVSDTAIGLTIENIEAFERLEVLMVVEQAAIRCWFDATGTPTVALGMLLLPGTIIKVHRRDLARGFRAFRAGDTNAQLSVQYCENASYDDAMPAIEILPENEQAVAGPPTYDTDDTGQDAYETVLTTPSRVCGHLLVQCETNDAIISMNGGTTDHLYVTKDKTYCLDGLAIPGGQAIQAKNASAGNNYANLKMTVW